MEQELAFRLQHDGIHYRKQVEIRVTTADFYFPLESRPLLVFVDSRDHLGRAQIIKDEDYDRYYDRGDTESQNYNTTTTHTRKETNTRMIVHAIRGRTGRLLGSRRNLEMEC